MVTSPLAQQRQLLRRFQALANDSGAEVMRKLDNGLSDDRVAVVDGDRGSEGSIDLDGFDRIFSKTHQRRASFSKVVDMNSQPIAVQFRHRLQRTIVMARVSIFAHFEFQRPLESRSLDDRLETVQKEGIAQLFS